MRMPKGQLASHPRVFVYHLVMEVVIVNEKEIKQLKKQLAEQEAESSLKRTLDGRIVKGGGCVGESYSGTAQINK